MIKSSFLKTLCEAKAKGEKKIALLIDPDKAGRPILEDARSLLVSDLVDFLFVGGSLISEGDLDETVKSLKSFSDHPLVIFPGAAFHVSEHADSILFLSLVSGRNPEFLIGQQLLAAPKVKSSGLEVCPTAYLLIDGGRPTSVSYISNTLPIPNDKPDIAAVTAMTAEMMGMKLVFMDAGSGAMQAISPEMVKAVRAKVDCPIIVGGGLRKIEHIKTIFEAGADLVVVGSLFEDDSSRSLEVFSAIKDRADIEIF